MSCDVKGAAKEARAALDAHAPKHRSTAAVELVTTAALALSTAVAVTAVSIGIARADVVSSMTRFHAVSFAIALSIILLMSAMGGFTAMVARGIERT